MTEASASSSRREPVVNTLPVTDDADAFVASRPPARSWPWMAATVVLAIVATVLVWRQISREAPPAPAAAVAPPVVAAPAVPEPAIRYPIERMDTDAAVAAPSPLPTLAESDAALQERLSAIAGAAGVERLLMTPNVVRRIVATIDNLPRASVAAQVMAARPAEGAFVVETDDGRTSIGRANTLRYAPYLAAMKAIDTPQLLALYARFYPLFQEAYHDLGYPNGYFNDRLVDVIDHLLATPEPVLPPGLVQPRVLYEYANPDLEARSAGQKALLRMGSDNARAVKAKLREIRAGLTRGAPPRQ